MKLQPSICLLSALAMAGALLHGCEGGIDQLAPGGNIDNELVAAYVNPLTPSPGLFDGDKLPTIDGDPQDREWEVAQPLYAYVSGAQGTGGRGYYVELRAIWSDEGKFSGGKNQLYLLLRYGDETFDIFPDYWRYARLGPLGLVPSPSPDTLGGADCDSVLVDPRNWYVENAGAAEDQVSFMFEQEPASDSRGTFAELGCDIACHAGGGRNFGAVPTGRLDVWVWRAGRTNVQTSTGYPDFTQVDDEDGRPASSFTQRFDPPTSWPAYMDDMHAGPAGLEQDAGDPTYPYYNRSRGQAWSRNTAAGQGGTSASIPLLLTQEKPREDRGGGSGSGGGEPIEAPNDGLPTPLYLWGPTSSRFTECDIVPWSRIFSGSVAPIWSSRLAEGETDVLPGYALWIPSGSAADVRARGDFKENAQKRFPIWALEIRRAFDTGNADDVAFSEDNVYNFTVAIFDRSSTVHSGSGPLRLRFQPSVFGSGGAIKKTAAEPGTAETRPKGGRS